MEANLAYKDGSSDKVYQAQIVESGEGFMVNFQYGRRGSVLVTGSKTTSPVSSGEALKIYQKLVNSKKAKGYTESTSGIPYIGTAKEDKVVGIGVQLLNPAEESELTSLFLDDDIIAQEKYDGKRIVVTKVGQKVTASNRTGLACGMPEVVSYELKSQAVDFIIDGEMVGEVYHVFDILSFGGKSLLEKSYAERYKTLQSLYLETPSVRTAENYETEEQKRDFYLLMKALNKEGIVFKNKNAPYVAGRPNKGGTQLKFKFQSEATCQVVSINPTKRSMLVSVGGVEVGNCAIPANKPIPSVGDFVEVRYLYFFEGGSLFQPFFKGIRDDKTESDSLDSLKRKGD